MLHCWIQSEPTRPFDGGRDEKKAKKYCGGCIPSCLFSVRGVRDYIFRSRSCRRADTRSACPRRADARKAPPVKACACKASPRKACSRKASTGKACTRRASAFNCVRHQFTEGDGFLSEDASLVVGQENTAVDLVAQDAVLLKQVFDSA